MNLEQKQIHFVGIGGVGMSGLAELLKRTGLRISGSDLQGSATLDHLRNLGIRAQVGHRSSQLGKADLVVVSSAIPDDNPELAEARERGIPIMGRGELLAEVMREKRGIAIAGTHGKTTTTAMTCHLLSAAGLDPSALVGGHIEGTSGVRLGSSEWFVAEADESDASFLHLAPSFAVITNVDADHLDHYGSFEALEAAFARFASRISAQGALVACSDDPGVRALLPNLQCRAIRYGLQDDTDLRASNIRSDKGGMRFDVETQSETLGRCRLPVPGEHNVANALAAIAIAREIGVPFATSSAAFENFQGVSRRFESKGTAQGIEIVDDYGHHPAEIRATLAAARGRHAGRIVVVFQPHRYTRTRDSFEDFTTAFGNCDVLVVTRTYPAGEQRIPEASARRLHDAIQKHGHSDVSYLPGFDEILAELPGRLRRDDLVITLGAGDVSQLGRQLLERIEIEDRV